MDKNDWYFVISFVLAVIALLGMDWKLVLGRVSVPSQTREIVLLLAVVGSLVMSGIGWYKINQGTNPSDIPTSLSLQFNAAGAYPIETGMANIKYWYTFHQDFIEIDSKTGQQTLKARTWAVFLVFEKPVSIRQFRVEAGGAGLPIYEIKTQSPGHAVIAFSGDIVGATVNFRVHD